MAQNEHNQAAILLWRKTRASVINAQTYFLLFFFLFFFSPLEILPWFPAMSNFGPLRQISYLFIQQSTISLSSISLSGPFLNPHKTLKSEARSSTLCMVCRAISFRLWHLQVSSEVPHLPYWKWVNLLTLRLPCPHPSWFQTRDETPPFESSNIFSHKTSIGHFIQITERRKEAQNTEKNANLNALEPVAEESRVSLHKGNQQCTILLFLPQEHIGDSQNWDANPLLVNLGHLAQTHQIKKSRTSNICKNRLRGISTNQRSQMWSPAPDMESYNRAGWALTGWRAAWQKGLGSWWTVSSKGASTVAS